LLYLGDYALLAADLRQFDEFTKKLSSTGLNTNHPTLVIAECVFVYIAGEQTSALLKFLTQTFLNIAMINYEQVLH
jgi:O-methyltransferase involved in polyketide biosynthesis